MKKENKQRKLEEQQQERDRRFNGRATSAWADRGLLSVCDADRGQAIKPGASWLGGFSS